MSYKDFIEKFVESSSLSEKDSKLLALEMESDFYAKEKDLILNNEKDTMKKIEDDFGDKDKLAEQMFLAHHKYLNIPILGPLLFFKAFRITLLLILLFPLNYFIGATLRYYLIQLQFPGFSNDPYLTVSGEVLTYLPGYLIPYIVIAVIWAKRKTNIKNIILGSILYSLLVIVIFLLTGLEDTILMNSVYSSGILLNFVLTIALPSLSVIFPVALTLFLRKILKWKK